MLELLDRRTLIASSIREATLTHTSPCTHDACRLLNKVQSRRRSGRCMRSSPWSLITIDSQVMRTSTSKVVHSLCGVCETNRMDIARDSPSERRRANLTLKFVAPSFGEARRECGRRIDCTASYLSIVMQKALAYRDAQIRKATEKLWSVDAASRGLPHGPMTLIIHRPSEPGENQNA